MKKILQTGARELRGIAKEVPAEDIKNREIRRVISGMKDTLASEKDGVAIAAPQVGEPFRIFIISGKIFSRDDENKKALSNDLVFINPEIIKKSRKKDLCEEGCLSVRNKYGKVERSKKIKMSAFNESGDKVTTGAEGFLAQIFQHEIDHLDGILFTDKAIEVKEINQDEKEKGE